MNPIMKMLRRSGWVHALTLAALLPGMILWPSTGRSNPTGGTVTHGEVIIDDLTPGHLKILQSSDKAIINWEDFSIGAGELTEFLQPGASSMALNRVISGNPSSIYGTLQANGGVILVNPNGILVGAGGVVDIGGLAVLSTLDIDDADFLDGGTMRFFGKSEAAVTNLGTITSRGGDVVLLANMINNEGTVGAPDGTVAFGAGGEFIVDTIGDSRISVIGAGPGGQTGIKNSGTVTGSAVEFKAHGNVYALAIQNTGIVRATGINRQGGRIILSAAGDGSVGGRIENTGVLEARNADGSGGTILIDGGKGGQVDILGGRVDADGDGNTDGGTITVLGDVVNVTGDARVTANGANGGFVQLGSPQSTKAITVGPGATVSANGTAGNGGVVQLLGNSSSVINVAGTVTANGTQAGGVVQMTGGTITTAEGSVVSADGGVAGGQVGFSGKGVNLNGAVSATSANGTGGRVLINGAAVQSGAASSLDVSGSTVGGTLFIDSAAGGVNLNGAVNANSAEGSGGTVIIRSSGGGVNVGEEGNIKADGADNGGTIDLDSSTNTGVNGGVSATGLNGLGGRIKVAGDSVVIGGTATLDASGGAGGGNVSIGGGFQGKDLNVRNSRSTVIQDGAKVKVNALNSGDGGTAVVWSDGSTFYRGDISAQAFGAFGNGGFIEISGKETLSVGGTASTLSANGRAGTLLIDPVNVTVGSATAAPTIVDTTLVGFVNAGNVIVHTAGAGVAAGDITILPDANVIYDSPYSLTFLAHGNIFVDGDIKNHGTTDYLNAAGGINNPGVDLEKGTGHINLVAGWSGTLPGGVGASPFSGGGNVSAADFINPDGTPLAVDGQFGSWGRPDSYIRLNNAASEYVEVASARGQTNLFADFVILQGGDADGEATQVGYRRVADQRAQDAAQVALVPGMATSLIVDRQDGVVGDINVTGKSAVLLIPNPDVSGTIGEGQKNRNNLYVRIGHGGHRSGNNNWDNKNPAGTEQDANFGDEAGTTAVGNGDLMGDITVYAGLVFAMVGDRVNAHTQVGHGGAWESPANSGFSIPEISGFGNQADGDSEGIFGNIQGDIRVTAGDIHMEGGVFDDSFTMIGHGGRQVIGEFSGDVTVTSTIGSIRGIAAPEVGAVVNGNNRDRTFVQIGHGGFRSYHFNARTLTAVRVAGDGVSINPLTGLPYGHNGNINVTSAGGIHFTAGGNQGQAHIGHGGQQIWGDMRGDVSVTALNGDIIFDRILVQSDAGGNDRGNRGIEAFVQIGHGGRLVQGGHTGNIDVSATGNLEMYAGRADAYALVGHGGRGWEDNTSTQDTLINIETSVPLVNPDGTPNPGGNIVQELRHRRVSGTHIGDINIEVGGDIKFRGGSGFGQFTFAQVGHGGWFQQADTDTVTPNGGGAALVDTGHHGDISVTAHGLGGISFIAGATDLMPGQTFFESNNARSWVQIGHGGDQSRGDHWGNIDVTATAGDIVFEGRGGWDAVTIEGTDAGADPAGTTNDNQRGTPRIGIESNEDNGHTGWRNWAQIGHGGMNSGNSGENAGTARGIGVHGQSDITVTAAGDVVIKAAQLATVGNPTPIAITPISGAGTDADPFVYGTASGMIEQGLRTQQTRPTVITRWNGDVWTLPEPVAAATNSWGMIGHGGRATDGSNGGTDGSGHMGNITVTAGGSVTAVASDIDVRVGQNQALHIDVDSFANGIDGMTDFVIQVGPNARIDEMIRTNGVSGNFGGQNNYVLFGQNFAMIGNGGYQSRGDHRGDITVTGGIDGTGLGLLLQGGGSLGSFAQIGNGGYDSDGQNNDNSRLNDSGSTGTISVQVDGDIFVRGGIQNGQVMGAPGTVTVNNGDGDQVVTASNNDSFVYAQIGNGGYANGGTHSGDITVVSTAGGVTVEGGFASSFAYAQIGNGGGSARGQEHNGNILVVADKDVVVRAGGPIRDSLVLQSEIDNPELANTGHISRGIVNYAQIGNGGWDSDPQGGNLNLAAGIGGHFGDIEVISVNGSVLLRGGGDPTITINDDSLNRGNSAHIGNGGNFTDGDHRGNIRVSAGLDVEVIGGGGSRDSFTQIGHGALQVDGDMSGSIEVIAGRDLIMNKGGDTDTGTGGVDLFVIRNSTNATSTGGFTFSRVGTTTIDNTARFILTGNAGTDTFTTGFANGLVDGDRVMFTGGITGGAGLAIDTPYFVVNANPGANTFQLSTTFGGAAIDFTSNQGINGNNVTNGGLQRVITYTGDSATDIITPSTPLGLQIGDRIRFTEGFGAGEGTGISSATIYFVRDVDPVTGSFRISTSNGGAAVDFTTDIVGNDDYGVRDGTGTMFRTTRDGSEIFNNYAKIGHGDHLYRQRNSGNGTRNGDIDISVGNDVVLADPANRALPDAAYTRLNSDIVLIGHIDPVNSSSSAFRNTVGHTYVGASRVDPFITGTGALRIFNGAVLTSAGAGFFGELRLYVPTPALNFIEDGAFFNNNDYTRTPTPDGTRADELIGPDHTQTTGAFGEVDGAFVPDGVYAPSGFGLYNIYYSTVPPVVPPVVPPAAPVVDAGILAPVVVPPLVTLPVVPAVDFGPFAFTDKFDSYDRFNSEFGGGIFGGLFSLFGRTAGKDYESSQDDGLYVEGEEILEESPGLFGLGPAQSESEEEEEEEKSGNYMKSDNVPYGIFWSYDVSTGKYSSFRTFGFPASELAD